ncbi:MAG: dethiobiotin synthase [Desulfatiglans sp.]|jgi:dethiobiotin synthase|nr:dethiobiotin synthase [Thermodesulfobacteriota bacterium]MEE4354261.1 dethiobiotin synthase [Desulfatiglans sp.]
MHNRLPKEIFVTGSDTDVGKTVVSGILLAGLGAEYWKPVQSGTEEMTDTEWLKEKTGLPRQYFHQETYRLKRALSPHASAAQEGIRLDIKAFHLPERDRSRHLVVEGAGGLMVPLNEECFILDLIKSLNIPVLLVTSSRLGTINHTLLSLEQMRRHHLDLLGVVINGPKNPSNRDAITHYGKIEILAEIEPLTEITPQTLKRAFERYFT